MGKRLFYLIALLLTAAGVQAQKKWNVYFANNIGDVTNLTKITKNDKELKWTQLTNGMVSGNYADVQAVQTMFKSTRQKTKADQRLFWKMRDDNLLCFRINDGRGTYGEYEVMVRSSREARKRVVTSYLFVNTDNHSDVLNISFAPLGAGPNDTIRFKYYINDWGNDDLLLFKLDSRRSQTGLKYQLEYTMQDMAGTKQSTGRRELSGTTFQSFYVPQDSMLTNVYLLSEGKRMPLDMKRLIYGANLSDKLNKLWASTNFTLDKHENRELTIFNMLGSGLFEKYDTLYLKVLSSKGKPIEVTVDPATKLAKGFSFNIAAVDANGRHVTRQTPMKYVGYDPKEGYHKILTFGDPCYIEVIAPDHHPSVFRYAGALNPKTKVLDAALKYGVIRLMEGQVKPGGTDIASHYLYALKDTKASQDYDGKLHEVFRRDSCDLNLQGASVPYVFIEDGGWQRTPKLLDGQPVDKYAEMDITFSYDKNLGAKQTNITVKAEELKNKQESYPLTPTSQSLLDGIEFTEFKRSYFTQRFNLVGALPKKDVEYKLRYLLDGDTIKGSPILKRTEIKQEEMEQKAKDEAIDYSFKKFFSYEHNVKGMKWFDALGKFLTLDIKLSNFPGFYFSVTPNFDILAGVYEFDVNLGCGFRDAGDNTKAAQWKKKIKEGTRASRFRFNENNKEHTNLNPGVDLVDRSSTSPFDDDDWNLSQIDDIFRVEQYKLGWGPSFDGHFNFGWKLKNNNAEKFAVNAFEVYSSFGAYAASAKPLLSKVPAEDDKKWQEFMKWLPFNLVLSGHAMAEFRFGGGMRTYNFMKNGIITQRDPGIFMELSLTGKAGFTFQLQSFFGDSDGEEEKEEGGGGAGDNDGNNDPFDILGGGGNNIINDGGSDSGISLAPERRAKKATASTWATRLFSFAAGIRGGAKLQFLYDWVYLRNHQRVDNGAYLMATVVAEAFADLKLGPAARFNPRISIHLGPLWPITDSAYNPTIPGYPNYKPNAKAPQRLRGAQQQEHDFLLGNCLMDNLSLSTMPYFLGPEVFIACHNGTNGADVNDDRIMTFPAKDKLTQADGTVLTGNSHYAKNHKVAKEGEYEAVVYEELDGNMPDNMQDIDQLTVDQELEQAKRLNIVANVRDEDDGKWRKYVVASDPTVIDSEPEVAINVYTDESQTTADFVDDYVACVWKRGRYVLPTYADATSTAEEAAEAKKLLEASTARAFEGDLMISIFDGEDWSEPESLMTLTKDDVLADYQVVMLNDTALVAASVLLKDMDKPQLRYISKPYNDDALPPVIDTMQPVRFSLSTVGPYPTVAILHPIDTLNNDVYVKQIDLKGGYSGNGAELNISRFAPMSVRVVADRKVVRPEDFAVVWQGLDREIRQDGKTVYTDSARVLLNVSKVYMRESLDATPYITLGCTADSLVMTGYDAFLDDDRVKVLYTLSDVETQKTWLMSGEAEFYNDFNYEIGYAQEAMLSGESLPVSVEIQNTGATPITALTGYINDHQFEFEDLFINPYTTQTLTVDYPLTADFNGLLRAHDVTAVFEDAWEMTKAARRGARGRRAITSTDTQKLAAAGYSDVSCKLLSQTIEGDVNKVYVELTDNGGLKDIEDVYVGLYTDRSIDIPIAPEAERILRNEHFTDIGGQRKAYVELMVENVSEPIEVELRARVYNRRVAEELGGDDVTEALVDNLSWQDNLRYITLLPSELDEATGVPVVSQDEKLHKIKVDKTEEGIWISGLETGDELRIFDAAGKAYYINRKPQNRQFVPIHEHDVYLISTGQEVVKFTY